MNQKISKFEGVTFSPEKVELWTPKLISGQGFRCQRGEFVTYWEQGRIAREVKSHIVILRAFTPNSVSARSILTNHCHFCMGIGRCILT